MPRFVLLRHEFPPTGEKPSHWDFMLEVEGVLWTWELRKLPESWSRALGAGDTSDPWAVPVTRLPDHRLAYLEYEGPVSGGRGHVVRLDAGEFDWIVQSKNQVEVDLHGQVLHGRLTISRDEMSVE